MFKGLKKILMASAFVLTFAGPASAADTPFGSCTGASGTDCTANAGHVSVSVTDTLSINEMRAVSFGNIAVSDPDPGDQIVLGLDGSRTVTGTFTLLHGADGDATGGAGGTATEVGAQHPGHYTVSGGSEGGAEIYISFADSTGNIIDMCSSAETQCDNYHAGNSVSLGNGLTVDHFFINQTGSDVYGHYVSSDGTTGIATPWGPGHAATVTGAGVADVRVGARLVSDGTALTVGKKTGTFNIMASY